MPEASTLVLPLLEGERWWGGAVADGTHQPFGARPHARDLATNAGFVDDPMGGSNQHAPLLVSSRGRAVWSDEPFAFAFDGAGSLTLTGEGVRVEQHGDTLAEAYRGAQAAHFPASGRAPAAALFAAPQYNTWIETPFVPTQEGVLAYARNVLANGFPPGVIMIDDLWARDYGTWEFAPDQFPDPAAMCAELHDLGFTVMVWLVPYVSPDSATARDLYRRGLLLGSTTGMPAVHLWWNGFSAVLDLTNPATLDWLRARLRALQDLGVDGFKLDAGDIRYYQPTDVSHSGAGPLAQCEAWARLGTEFGLAELRACWKLGGQPLAQRLHDKPRRWDETGLGSLIGEGIAQGLIGHAFTCPDMIGGGELTSFEDGAPIDAELFVRFAQCSALFPMMQFSLQPWRVLDAEHLAAVKAAVEVRQALLPLITTLVDHAARTGEPILRPLAYHHAGYEDVTDEFLLGEDLLVAPVLERGATDRRVLLPPGRWRSEAGVVTDGPATLTVPVGLTSLPRWERLA